MSGFGTASRADGVVAVTRLIAGGLGRQTRAPEEILAGEGALQRACASDARWIWLLADGGDPRPDALERLLEARLPDGATLPAIVAGTVVAGYGGVDERQLPGWSIGHPELIDLVGRGALPIRHATFANCLVASACFVRHGLPDERRFGPYAAIEWSARVLRDEPGCFVPASVVASAAALGRRDALRAVPALARMLRTGAWTRGDQLAHARRLLSRDGASGAR